MPSIISKKGLNLLGRMKITKMVEDLFSKLIKKLINTRKFMNGWFSISWENLSPLQMISLVLDSFLKSLVDIFLSIIECKSGLSSIVQKQKKLRILKILL